MEIHRSVRAYAPVAALVQRPTTTFAQALTDSAVDALVIATPPGTHVELARRTLLAGKDVLVEKPLALGLAAARELCTLANDTGRTGRR